MGCYHFHLNQLSRGKGQSAIASAAYRAGTKLECTYYGEVSDYTRKGGVVFPSIHSTSFQRVSLSLNLSGACWGRWISANTTPPFLV